MDKRVCLRKRDIKFIMFLGEYGIITNENVKMFYDSEYYYKNRLASLAKGEMVERLYCYECNTFYLPDEKHKCKK